MKKIDQKKQIVFLSFFFIISLCIFYYSYIYTSNIIKDSFLEQIKIKTQQIENKIKLFNLDKKSILLMLIRNDNSKDYIINKNKINKQKLEKLFINQIEASQNIFQARLLDLQGNELVRVDKKDEQILIPKDEDLQNKFERDYFQKFMNLKKDEIGFSKLDLNMEYGKIQKPFQSTIRFAMPVFLEDEKVAIIILNYNMNNFLEEFRNAQQFDIFIVDTDGFFIINPNKQLDWSRYTDKKINAKDSFNINLEEILSKKVFHFKDALVIKTIHFWDDLEKIVVFKAKDKIGIFDIIKKTKFSGLLIIFGILLLIIPVLKVIFDNLNSLKRKNNEIENSERKLLGVLDNTFDSIIMIDKHGIIKTVNKATFTTFGYTKRELLGQNVKILLAKIHHSKHDKYIKNNNKFNTLDKIVNKELFGQKKDGSLINITLGISKTIINNEVSFIGTIRDITEKKQMIEKEKIQEYKIMQQSKLAAMGEMVTAIAHQWRQPLNAIALIVHDLVSAQKYDELDESYVKEIKEDVNEQLKYMSDTIDEFRNFFKQNNENIDINLVGVLNDISKLLWTQLDESSISLNLVANIDSKIIGTDSLNKKEIELFNIKSKPSEIKQILINLVSNAKDAININRIKKDIKEDITIELKKINNTIKISVIDYAGGMKKNTINRIFEPYFTTKNMGTGLGLYICQTLANKSLSSQIICEKHSKVENTKIYKGTIFSIILQN